MTERLFWQDAYLREFDATIESADEGGVRLDRTAFNPRGGGLVSDVGKLNGADVVEVVKKDEEIYHLLGGGTALRPGESVHGVIDWARRHRVMRMHTTAHILSAIVNRETDALITGNQINPVESRMDFSLDSFDREKFGTYVEIANEAVRSGAEVKTYFMRREEALKVPGLVKLAGAVPPDVEELRIVQIGDIDVQADGGVHVKTTSEIGEIVMSRIENKGKNNRRLYFLLRP